MKYDVLGDTDGCEPRAGWPKDGLTGLWEVVDDARPSASDTGKIGDTAM